jgi:hypothetical protein
VHDHEHAREQKPEQAAERAAPANVPAALALQRQIGNRAFGRLISRTPEEAADLLEPAITGAHFDTEQISRTFLPFSQDQDGFDKMAEAYETKTEVPLQKALETHVPPGEMDEIGKRVPWRGFPPPKSEGAAEG